MREKIVIAFSLCAVIVFITIIASMHRGKVVVQEVPEEIRSFVVIDEKEGGAIAHVFRARSLDRLFSGESGDVRDVATNGQAAAAVLSYNSSDSAVMWWSGEGDVVTVERGEEEKDSIALSADGALVVYTRSLRGSVPEVILREIHEGNSRVIGPGYNPHLVSYHPNGDGEEKTVLLYDAPEGLLALDVSNEVSALLPEFSAVFSEGSLHTSPSGRYIAVLNKDANEYAIFEVYRLFPIGLSSLGVIRNTFVSIALSDDALYGVIDREGKREVVRLPLRSLTEEPSKVFTFPNTITPSRLIAPIR